MENNTKENPKEGRDFIRKMHENLHWHALNQVDLSEALWKIFLWQSGSVGERIKKVTEIMMPGEGQSVYYSLHGENVALDWNEDTVRDLLIFASGMRGRSKRVKGKGSLSELEMLEQAELIMKLSSEENN